MSLRRKQHRIARHTPRNVISCLEALGVQHRRRHGERSLRKASFWVRNEANLNAILFDAKQLYRKLVAKLHPDRGGCEEQCRRLNQIWQRIELLFRRKGITLCD